MRPESRHVPDRHGQKGLREIAKTNHLNTAYFVKESGKFSHVNVKYKKNFYNEIVLEIKNTTLEDFTGKLEAEGILPGIPLNWFSPDMEDALLVNFTEKHKKKDIDRLIAAIGELQ